MADVRALLKAKRQEVRITHPYAAYGANGALRCTACGSAIKFTSAWEGHLGSKAHRVAVANLRAKEEEARRRATTGAVSVSTSKRKAEEGEDEYEDEDEDGEGEEQEQVETAMATGKKKRQRTEERDIPTHPVIDGSPDARSTGTGTGATRLHLAFPADFFSDPARAAPPRTSQDDDDDDVEMDQDQDQDAKAATAAPPKSQFDKEWDAFERDMQNLSHQKQQRSSRSRPAASATAEPQEETYAHATIAAEPELVASRFDGLPVAVDGATAQEEGTEQGTGTGTGEGGRRKVSEEELERRRKERDERELIMDRLMEEERAQEDAYGRVSLLKNRIQMLKQKRELAKAKGKKVAADMET